MTPNRLLARSALAACLIALAAPVAAQPLRTAGPPADFPPDGYEERQFVDSRGCVYIRAGVDGNVTWVPRVNRDREQLCGFQPTFADAPAPRPAPQPEPEAPAETQVVEAPKPQEEETPAAATAPRAETRTAEAAPRPAPRSQAQQRSRPAPAPVRMEVPRRAPSPAPRATGDPIRTVAGAQAQRPAASREPAEIIGARCPGGTPVSQRYLVGREGERLRCGPQAKPPHTYRILTAAAAEALPSGARVYRYAAADSGGGAKVYRSVSGRPVSGEARVLPRHLWQPSLPDSARVEVPEGYEPAWEDGRLNPRRAEQTLNGRERMLLVWTNTTPRRLIDRASGEDVTAQHPRLFYPFTDIATQNAYLSAKDDLEVGVASDGRVRLVQKPDAQARVTTRSAPAEPVAKRAQPSRQAAATPRAAASHRFVQVGTFGVPANAQRTAARLQSMGLPVRLSPMTRGGKSYQIVLAGPFATETQLRGALVTARRAGFADAFPRN
jgi:cell division protein FtsN/outer membrane biosynthesis protein TonB